MKKKRLVGILYLLFFILSMLAGYAVSDSDFDEMYGLIEKHAIDTPRLTDLLDAYDETIATNNTQEIQLAENELFQYIQKTVELQNEYVVLSDSVTLLGLEETHATTLMKIHQFLVVGDIESAEPLIDALNEDIKEILLPEFEKYKLLLEEQQKWYVVQNISLDRVEQEKKSFERAYEQGDAVSLRDDAEKIMGVKNQSSRYIYFVNQADKEILENPLLNERKDEVFYAFSQRDDALSGVVDIYLNTYDELNVIIAEEKLLETQFALEVPYLSVSLMRSLNNTLQEGKTALMNGDLENAKNSFKYVREQVQASKDQREFTTILAQDSDQVSAEANWIWYLLLSLKLLLFAGIIIFEKNLLEYELKRLEKAKEVLGNHLKQLQKLHFQQKNMGKESFDTQTKIIQENLFDIYEKIAYVTYHKKQLEERRRK